MSVRPLDLQVNIGQINHVARAQQNEQSHAVLQQNETAAHLARDAVRTQETVQETGHSSADHAVRDAPNREGAGHEASGQGEGRDRKQSRSRGPSGVRYADEDKGGLVDIKR